MTIVQLNKINCEVVEDDSRINLKIEKEKKCIFH